ncbi:hypothetical protein [Lactobacillus sp. PSON]|uniref:hypothetical protein n=1 Tax=Lactobacillus sp. PSON TaxID=3455454 RepID=UPI0040413028
MMHKGLIYHIKGNTAIFHETTLTPKKFEDWIIEQGGYKNVPGVVLQEAIAVDENALYTISDRVFQKQKGDIVLPLDGVLYIEEWRTKKC